MRGTKRLLLAAAVGALALAGCSTTVNTDDLEGQIAQELEAQAGVRARSVECPDDVAPEAGATFECTATAEDGSTATITVTQQDDQGNLSWEVTDTG
jgi:outer membrane murein-binding lipoprotein Lpp